MRTIAITSFHPLISRNILATPLLAELTGDSEIRIILFVPEEKQAFFEREFGGPRVSVVAVAARMRAVDVCILDLALSALKTRSMAIRRRWEFLGRRNYAGFLAKTGLARLMAGRAWTAGFVRWLDARFGSRGPFADILKRERPDLLFATDLQHETDLACMRAARDLGIPIAGMTRSWDNPTAKGLIRLVPDVAITQNEILRDELIRLQRIPADCIRVVGAPHYDRYIGYRPESRSDFFQGLGLDPAGRLVLFTPIGLRHVRENVIDREVIELIVRAKREGALPPNLQVLVRLPPTITVDLAGFVPPPWIKIEQPGTSFGAPFLKDSELDREDERHLMDSLFHTELVLTGPSTIAIDAAVFDKPIVLIDFDNGGRGYWESIRCWYDYDHFRPILEAAGARRVRDAAECLTALRHYLAHPDSEQVGRAEIVREELWRTDAQSTARLAGLLEGLLAGQTGVRPEAVS